MWQFVNDFPKRRLWGCDPPLRVVLSKTRIVHYHYGLGSFGMCFWCDCVILRQDLLNLSHEMVWSGVMEGSGMGWGEWKVRFIKIRTRSNWTWNIRKRGVTSRPKKGGYIRTPGHATGLSLSIKNGSVLWHFYPGAPSPMWSALRSPQFRYGCWIHHD
jgi:hypothetical protein